MKFKIGRWSNGEPAATLATTMRTVCAVVDGLHSCDGSTHSPLQPVSGDGARETPVVQEVRNHLSEVCNGSQEVEELQKLIQENFPSHIGFGTSQLHKWERSPSYRAWFCSCGFTTGITYRSVRYKIRDRHLPKMCYDSEAQIS